MFRCANRIQVTTYITDDIYEKIESERAATGESQSGLICSVLEAYYTQLEELKA